MRSNADLYPLIKVTNDMTFVPLRFLSEQFGLSVEWLQETKAVVLTK